MITNATSFDSWLSSWVVLYCVTQNYWHFKDIKLFNEVAIVISVFITYATILDSLKAESSTVWKKISLKFHGLKFENTKIEWNVSQKYWKCNSLTNFENPTVWNLSLNQS